MEFTQFSFVLLIYFIGKINSERKIPSECLSKSSTTPELIECFEKFMWKQNFIPEEEWANYAPKETQRNSLMIAIENLLQNPDCSQLLPQKLIQDGVRLENFKDQKTNRSHCVLYENLLSKGFFKFSYPIFLISTIPTAIPVQSSVKVPVPIPVHISAPHPISDGRVHIQSAHLFNEGNAKSLLISSIRRDATPKRSFCESKFRRLKIFFLKLQL